MAQIEDLAGTVFKTATINMLKDLKLYSNNEWTDREFQYRDSNYKKNQMKTAEMKSIITK